MSKSITPRVLCAALLLATFVALPESLLAQRGGHGGGFHGGGGFSGGGGPHGGGFSGGGHYYGGYHGGGYYGRHGGYYGGGNGFWGYPGYGYGWGFGISFGWGPYWVPGPAYPYGYSPVWSPPYYPYYYPYPYYYYSYTPASYSSGSPDPNIQSSNDVRVELRPEQSSAPASKSIPNMNSVTIRYAAYAPTSPGLRTHAASSDYKPGHSAAYKLPAPLRPEVQNVIRALRGMPPGAREREIDSGRYTNLSPEELRLVKYAADLPPV
jgi:hypothetical protein